MASPNSSSVPDPSPVIELIESFRRSKAMFAAVSLGIFDVLERAPANLATLATELRVQTRTIGAIVGRLCRSQALAAERRGAMKTSR